MDTGLQPNLFERAPGRASWTASGEKRETRVPPTVFSTVATVAMVGQREGPQQEKGGEGEDLGEGPPPKPSLEPPCGWEAPPGEDSSWRRQQRRTSAPSAYGLGFEKIPYGIVLDRAVAEELASQQQAVPEAFPEAPGLDEAPRGRASRASHEAPGGG